MAAKVELVAGHRGLYGLNTCLGAVGLSKSTWYAHQHPQRNEEDERLRERILTIIGEHPDYGYRRIVPELVECVGKPINHKRVRRILSGYELGLPRCLPASTPSRVQTLIREVGASADLVKGRSFAPFQAFSTDFTELVYAHGQQKAWGMVLLDIESRWAGGWAVAPRRHRQTAQSALDRLRSEMVPYGRDLEDVIIHHDKDSVYTSHDWLRQVLLKDRGRLSYAEHGAKDNPWIESFWGRMKTEIGSLLWEAQTLDEVRGIVDRRMNYYNRRRRHSALDYRPPEVFLRLTVNGEIPLRTLAQISP